MPTKEMERKKEEECNKSGDFYNVKIIAIFLSKFYIYHIIAYYIQNSNFGGVNKNHRFL